MSRYTPPRPHQKSSDGTKPVGASKLHISPPCPLQDAKYLRFRALDCLVSNVLTHAHHVLRHESRQLFQVLGWRVGSS